MSLHPPRRSTPADPARPPNSRRPGERSARPADARAGAAGPAVECAACRAAVHRRQRIEGQASACPSFAQIPVGRNDRLYVVMSSSPNALQATSDGPASIGPLCVRLQLDGRIAALAAIRQRRPAASKRAVPGIRLSYESLRRRSSSSSSICECKGARARRRSRGGDRLGGALCCSMALRTMAAPQLCKRGIDVDARENSMDAVRAYVEYGRNLNP